MQTNSEQVKTSQLVAVLRATAHLARRIGSKSTVT